eukprot:scaffold94727_cov17-Tisochrysis_lutea.AAC.2
MGTSTDQKPFQPPGCFSVLASGIGCTGNGVCVCPRVGLGAQAMALNREPPTVEDSRKEDQTIVPNEDIDEQAGQELEEFKENVMGPDYKPFQGKTGA